MTAQVCVFNKLALDGPGSDLLSKRIELGPEGRPVADGSPCRMAAGTAVNASVPDAAALARLINAMSPSTALSIGAVVHANGKVTAESPLPLWRGYRQHSVATTPSPAPGNSLRSALKRRRGCCLTMT